MATIKGFITHCLVIRLSLVAFRTGIAEKNIELILVFGTI